MLFDFDLPIDNSPPDNTDITTIQLFYSVPESKEFKELCKQGMMKMYPHTFANSNINDFLLEVLRLYNK